MSDESNIPDSVSEEASVNPSESSSETSGESSEELQGLVTSFEDSNSLRSSGSNPELSSDSWDEDISEVVSAIKESDKKEEAEVQGQSAEEPKEYSKGDSEESENKDREEGEESLSKSAKEKESLKDSSKENSENPSKLVVKTKEGEIEVSLEEIKKDYPEVLENLKSGISGSREIAKRFSELDVQKKAFQSEKTEIEGYINTFQESVKDGNILGGLTYFAEFANIPAYLLKEQLIASLRPEIEKRSHLSEDQINNMRLLEENRYLMEKNESDQRMRAEEQAQASREAKERELQAQINSIRETHKISEEEWEEAFKALDSELPPEQAEIPISAVKERVLGVRSEVQAQHRAEVLTAPHKDKVNDAFLGELKTLIKSRPDLTNEAISQVIRDSLKLQAERELEETLKKKSLENPKKVIKDDSSRSFKDLESLVEWD